MAQYTCHLFGSPMGKYTKYYRRERNEGASKQQLKVFSQITWFHLD
jgi:hypothetical protein